MNKPGKYSKLKYEACVAAVSDTRGYLMHHSLKAAALHAPDFREFVRDLREGIGAPFVLMIDNARIHVADDNFDLYEELGITVIRNVPYRPDLMGIEAVWKLAKDEYRLRVRRYTVQGVDWDQAAEITDILHGLDTHSVRECARKGLERALVA